MPIRWLRRALFLLQYVLSIRVLGRMTRGADCSRVAWIAKRRGVPAVPMVQAGLSYERGSRWRSIVRYRTSNAALDEIAMVVATAERRVRVLSGLTG